MKTRNLVLAVAALALAACNNENEAVVTPVALTVNANITDVSNTRVSTTSFEATDVIGVSVKSNDNYDGLTKGINVKYTAEAVTSSDSNNGKIVFKSTSPIYFADGKTVTFSAYYPYNSSVTADKTAISLNTTGQTASDASQSDYDFLYAEADGSVASSDISMTFYHKMAKLTFTFVAGSGVKDDTKFFDSFAKTYTVEGLKHDGQFDTADGTTSFATDAEAEDITPAVPGENKNAAEGSVETESSSIIIYPQTPEAKTVKVTLTYNEVAYVATLGLPSDGNGFTAGNNYAYTVTLNQTGLTISSADIVDWVTKDQTGVKAEYEYPYDIKDQGVDDGQASGLAYSSEEELLFN